ncbi:MAG: methyl-accepting chemotaxis protein [Gammaproteobacteria bacterium]
MIPAETRALALAPLVATTVLGVLLFAVHSLLPSGSEGGLVMFVVAVVLIPVISYFIGQRLLARILGSNLGAIAAYAKSAVAGERHDAPEVSSAGSIAGSLASLAAQVEKMSTSIKAHVERINSEVEQLSAGSNEILFTTQMQAAAANETKQVMNDMSERIQAVSSLARDTEAISNKATSLSADGESVVQDAVRVMEQISSAMTLAAEQINALTNHAHDIDKVAIVIRDIADQTNLLALNAAIEAARAGEQGRGFAVVADEVKKLAVRTAQSTQEITSTIQVMQNQTMEAVDGIGHAMPLMQQGVEKAGRASEVLRDIRQESQNTLDKISQLAGEMDEQSQMVSNVVDSVGQILDMSSSTDKVAERTLQTSVTLSNTAMELLNDTRVAEEQTEDENDTADGTPDERAEPAKTN